MAVQTLDAVVAADVHQGSSDAVIAVLLTLVRFVEETMQPGMTVSAAARMHDLSPSLLFGWRRRMAEGGQVAVQADDEVVAASRMRELEARMRDLERLLGRKTLAAIPSPAQPSL